MRTVLFPPCLGTLPCDSNTPLHTHHRHSYYPTLITAVSDFLRNDSTKSQLLLPQRCRELPICRYYYPDLRQPANIFLGKGQHPMKPHRMRMVHDLIVNYDMHRKMDMCVLSLFSSSPATHRTSLTSFLRSPNPLVGKI